MPTPKICAFAGSTRQDSLNKKLIKIVGQGAKAAGAQVTYVDLRDLPMPLYDGDLEKAQGLPDNAKKFKQLLIAHQGFLISAPEYNSGISGVLKNAIDWASRKETPDEPDGQCFKNKVAGLTSASPGGLGGLRGLVQVRAILENIGVLVIPTQMAVPKAHEAFGPDGNLKDTKQQKAVENVGALVAQLLVKLNP